MNIPRGKRDEVPFYGMKEHAAIDVESGLILSTYMSKASEHDTNYFQASGPLGRRPGGPTRDIAVKTTASF